MIPDNLRNRKSEKNFSLYSHFSNQELEREYYTILKRSRSRRTHHVARLTLQELRKEFELRNRKIPDWSFISRLRYFLKKLI